jgi:hypothetical protein
MRAQPSAVTSYAAATRFSGQTSPAFNARVMSSSSTEKTASTPWDKAFFFDFNARSGGHEKKRKLWHWFLKIIGNFEVMNAIGHDNSDIREQRVGLLDSGQIPRSLAADLKLVLQIEEIIELSQNVGLSRSIEVVGGL